MKLNKSDCIVILFGLLLLILIFGVPRIIDAIPNTKGKLLGGVAFCGLMLIFQIFLTYKDIREKKYTTRVYIVLSDMLMLYGIGSLLYIAASITYRNYYTSDYLTINREIGMSLYDSFFRKIAFSLGFLSRSFFMRDKFLKNSNKENLSS
jgi:hypothetical protein